MASADGLGVGEDLAQHFRSSQLVRHRSLRRLLRPNGLRIGTPHPEAVIEPHAKQTGSDLTMPAEDR
jgi:hypothetical protein